MAEAAAGISTVNSTRSVRSHAQRIEHQHRHTLAAALRVHVLAMAASAWLVVSFAAKRTMS